MRQFLVVCVLFFVAVSGWAQISRGGKPLPYLQTKSYAVPEFEEMPAFNLEEEMRLNSLEGNNLKGGYRFAYKFITDFDRNNSGVSFVLPDGTKVWRLGIRSQNAYSINILFTEYELPEGACVYLYNKNQTHILGAFTHQNNSELNMLPVAPVQGEELIIEYHEPANVPFIGRLRVGEVNHGYLDFKAKELAPDQWSFSCMPPVLCYQDSNLTDKALERSVVALIIDGTIVCSGVMLNNTQSDGTPYLLTASHCLNNNFSWVNPDYAKVAGSIVCFFNYNSPLCETTLRGTEEMSVASAYYRAVNEEHDMALLELLEIPPVYYQPYYAGWNIKEESSSPHWGIHHPGGSVKRISKTEEDLLLETYETGGILFAEEGHWRVKRWSVGSTSGGSSGSPLIDKNGYVIGALTGGQSACYEPVDDYYYALSRAWEPEEETNRQLKTWLNPSAKEQQICEGFNPYASGSCIRLSNVGASGKAELIETTKVTGSADIPLFSNNSAGINEFVEKYNAVGHLKIYGAYLVTPAIGSDVQDLSVEVVVYTGTNKPENLVYKEVFQPAFVSKASNSENLFDDYLKPLNRAQESFVQFSEPFIVEGNFFIGYKILAAPSDIYFSVFNLPKGETTFNTTWLRLNNNWEEATAHPENPFKTSLFVDPVIQYTTLVANENINRPNPVQVIVAADRSAFSVQLPEGIEEGKLLLITPAGKVAEVFSLNSNHSVLSLYKQVRGVFLVKVICADIESTQKVLF